MDMTRVTNLRAARRGEKRVMAGVPVTGSVWGVLLCFVVLTWLPGTDSKVHCNEYDTCFSAQAQINMTDHIRQGHNQQACVVVTTAMECLEEARTDCEDAGYNNLPDFIVKGLDTKRQNLTAYTATYCGANGVKVTNVRLAAIVGLSLFSVMLCLF